MNHLEAIRPKSRAAFRFSTVTSLHLALLAFCLFSPDIATAQVPFSQLDNRHIPQRSAVFTYGAEAGDIDGDGDVDLIVWNIFSTRIQVLVNDGTGHYADVTASRWSRTNRLWSDLMLGDVDGDGDLDIVLYGRRSAEAGLIFINDGRGFFKESTQKRFPAGPIGAHAILVDVDRDKDLDIVGADWFSKTRKLYLNNGMGFFSDVTKSNLPNNSSTPWEVLAGDVDGDGDQDLFFVNDGVYLNNGRGVFKSSWPIAGYEKACFGDFDGDGDLDLFAMYTHRADKKVFMNDGRGRFSAGHNILLPIYKWPWGSHLDCASGDFDSDGDDDVIVGADSGYNWLVINPDSSQYKRISLTERYAGPGGTQVVKVFDADGDGDMDIFSGNAPGYASPQNQLSLNLHRHVHSPSITANLGKPYQLDFYATPGYGKTTQLAIPLLNTLPLPSPLPVPPFGLLGVNPIGMIMLPALTIPVSTGKTSIKLPVPNNKALLGQSIFSQSFTLHGLTPKTWHLTNLEFSPFK